MKNSFLTEKQRSDISGSIEKIKADINELQKDMTDGALIYFYEELERKARFAFNFIYCAQIYSEIEKGKSFSEQESKK